MTIEPDVPDPGAAPASDTRTAHGDIEGSTAQLTPADTLAHEGSDPPLDELAPPVTDRGYTPPEQEPPVDVPTRAEEASGQRLEQRLTQERTDVDVDDVDVDTDATAAPVEPPESDYPPDANPL